MVNQNYVTNRLIKETVDKNQKGYVEESVGEETLIVTGDINVIVKNTLEENLEGAIVTLTKDEEEYSGTTLEDGTCVIKKVPVGTYAVEATHSSYESIEQQFTVEESNNNLILTFEKQSVIVTGPTLEEEEGEF